MNPEVNKQLIQFQEDNTLSLTQVYLLKQSMFHAIKTNEYNFL